MFDSFPLALCIAGILNLFTWWVKYTVVDRKKVGHECNDIDEGLEPGKQKIKYKKVFAPSDVPNSAEIYAKNKKKGLHLINSQLSANRPLGMNSK